MQGNQNVGDALGTRYALQGLAFSVQGPCLLFALSVMEVFDTVISE